MAVQTTLVNKPLNPRGNDQSPLAYNRAKLFSGKALDFDGVNDDVLSTITISGAKTYCAWINADGTSNERIIGIATGGYSNITFSNNKFNMYDGTNIPETTTTFETDQWYFVVAVQEANNAKIYVNGISQPLSTTNWIEHTYTSATIAIGRDAAGSTAWFDGEISGVRVFNTALTAAQVADLYNNPEKVVPTGVDNTALKLWLPMQEGAGTTAYDGSGNGNHGTISGATYTHGIGAPVAQTAVIDWNKGTNLLTRSEEFLDSDWIPQSSVTLTSGQDAPDGSTNAFKYNLSAAVARAIDQTFSFGIAPYTFAIYVKAIVDTTIRIRSYDGWSEDISINVADGWTRVDSSHATSASSAANIGFFDVSGSTGDRFYIWGASLEQSASVGPYVRTGATAQTSPVLLPQGLTTGRDITGVNLFENVRKQGALNLDGNSWAEVHDNASLDITDAITLEAWVYWVPDGSNNGILSRWDSSTDKRSYILYQTSAGNVQVNVSTDGATSSGVDALSAPNSDEWHHIVGTYDGSEIKIYVDGAYSDKVSYTGNIYVTDINTDIAAYNNDNYLNSQIAQPRIYNRALTAEEVQRNYNAGKNIYTN